MEQPRMERPSERRSVPRTITPLSMPAAEGDPLLRFPLKQDELRGATEEMRKLDLTKWERIVFYPFGAVEALLLDRVSPGWRSRYMTEKFALEQFYPAA